MRKTAAYAVALSCALVGCKDGWTDHEKELVNAPGDVMRVLTIDNREDSLLLRESCSDFSVRQLKSAEYDRLAAKMIATVTSPDQDGVGIAGPQVGLLRRVVAVQRFDLPGEPFQVYPNIRIIARRGEKKAGAEGCLSVPDEYVPKSDAAGRAGRGSVMRYQDIDISYTSPVTFKDTVETVRDFTAVIFQHECDHLDGILFIDRL